ncbi:hypothetical protein BH23ACI1_BH23ACI1_31480 [soil metagenome]
MRPLSVYATAALALFMCVPAPAGAQDAEKYVYVAVLGSDGAPIEGLTLDHFAVREGGRDRKVVKAAPLRIPMHVAVLVDTSGHGGPPDESFRSAVVDFVERLAAVNHVAVYSFGDRATQVAEFTQDVPRLGAAVAGMFGGAHQRSHLIEGIDRALRDLAKIETRRPVIVTISSESPEGSGQTAGGVIRRLIAQSVAFHSVALASATGSDRAATVNSSIPESSRRLGGLAAAGEGDRERTQMVRQGTASTGGSSQRLTSAMALGQALTRLARELSNSYMVTFTRPGSDRLRDLQVGVMVDNVTLRATAAPFGTR